MGSKLKVAAVLSGLMLIPVGGWPLSAVLFLYAISGLVLRGLRRGRGRTATGVVAQASLGQSAQVAPAAGFKRGFGHPVRRILGLAFLGLSGAALAQGGTFSPL